MPHHEIPLPKLIYPSVLDPVLSRREGAQDAARVYDAVPATKNKVLVRRVAIIDYLIERLWFYPIMCLMKSSNNFEKWIVIYCESNYSWSVPVADNGEKKMQNNMQILNKILIKYM